MAITVPDGLKRPLKWVGYPLFAVMVANLSLYAALPRERIRKRVESLVADATGMKVTTTDFGLTLFSGPGITATGVTLEGPTGNPQEKPAKIVIDDVTVHTGLLQLVRGLNGASFKGHLASGAVKGEVRSVPDEGAFVLDVDALQLAQVPAIGDLIGLHGIPIGGEITLKLDVNAPKNLLAESGGSGKIELQKGVVGDGKAKLTVASNPLLANGLTLPKLQLGKVDGEVKIDRGRAVLKGVKSHSPDLDLEVQGYVDLRDPISLSQLHLYVMVKPSEALLKREANLEAMVTMGGALAKRTDNYYGISISGPTSNPLVLPSRETPAGLVPAVKPPPVAAPGGTAPSGLGPGNGMKPPIGSASSRPRPLPSPSTIEYPPQPPPNDSPPPMAAPPPNTAPSPTVTEQPVAIPPPSRIGPGSRMLNAIPPMREPGGAAHIEGGPADDRGREEPAGSESPSGPRGE